MEAPISTTILLPHLDQKFYWDHLNECGLLTQVEPYTVGNLSFFVKTAKPINVLTTENCRTCNTFLRKATGCYGKNHATTIQFPDGFMDSTISPVYKDIAKSLALPENSVVFEVLVLVNEKRVGIKNLGSGRCSLTGVQMNFPHLHVDTPNDTSFASTEYTQASCDQILFTYASKIEKMLQDDSHMEKFKLFQSWKDEITYAHQKFNGSVESFIKLYKDYWAVSASLNEMRITIIKYCLSRNEEFFHIGITYRLLKELIDIFESNKREGKYDVVAVKKLLEVRLDPSTRGHKIREPTQQQILDLQKKIGNVTVKCPPIWGLQDIPHFPLSNGACSSIDPNHNFTLKYLAEMQLKFKIRAGSCTPCAVVVYDMDEEYQTPGTKLLFEQEHTKAVFDQYKLNRDAYYDVSAIVPVDDGSQKYSSFLFVLSEARPPSTQGWYLPSYLHHSLHNRYARAFQEIKKPLQVVNGPQLAGVGTCIGTSTDLLTSQPEIMIGNLKMTITHSGFK